MYKYKLLMRGNSVPSDYGFDTVGYEYLRSGLHLYRALHIDPLAVYEWFGDPDSDLLWFQELTE